MYSSRYEHQTSTHTRTFRFDIKNKHEIIPFDGHPDFTGVGLCVEFNQPQLIWTPLLKSIDSKEVMDEIGSHFLPYFLFRWLPKITFQFNSNEPEDIAAHFKDVFVQHEAGTFECIIEGTNETLNYSLARIPKSRSFKNHCLLLSAAARIVGEPRDLTHKLGSPHFQNDKNEKYIVVAVVHGDAFESRLNDARTSIDLSPKAVEEIVNAVADRLQSTEKHQIEIIKTEQSTDLDAALRENPILRLGLKGRSLRDYVISKPNNWRAENFVSDLAIERHRVSQDIIKQISAAALSAEDYTAKIKSISAKLDDGNKEVLAEYVVHRKNIITLFEAARRYTEEGKHAPEDSIHELVFRRFKDNTDISYFEHNLWLVDDLLAFMPYISSDRAPHGKGRKTGDKITDLVFFDEPLVLTDNDGTTITIVEFKKPSRDDYVAGKSKSDPVAQVLETLGKTTDAGGFTKMDGTHFTLNGIVRRFAFIIADITPSFVQVLKFHDFKNDWNPKIFVRYRDTEKIFIQVMGYQTLIENAKKRNQAFFSVLFDE